MSIFYVDNGSSFGKKLCAYNIQTLTPAQLLQGDEAFHEAIKGLIILCELNVNPFDNLTARNNLYGINLARELRLKYESVYPILFVSFLPLEDINKKSVIASLIMSVGHDFLRLPASGEHIIRRIMEMDSLTPTELRDVQWFSCKPEGVVNSLIHQLPVIVHKLANDPGYAAEKAKADLEACIHQIHFVVQTNPDDCLKRFRKLYFEITQQNVAGACKFVKNEGEKIILEVMKKNTTTELVDDKKRPWKILMLDDELDKSSTIIGLLQNKGISVVYRDNAVGAMRALDRDDKHRNQIVLILCDYRLLEKRNGGLFHQKIQGYTFLQKVGERFQSRILSAVVYSGMPRKFLLETYKTFKMRTEIFSKADFGFDSPEAMNYITNRIAEIGDENYDALTALPLNNTGWEKHLHDWYLDFRSLNNYEMIEKDISLYCNKWINEYRGGLNPDPPLSKGSRIASPDKYTSNRSQKNKADKNKPNTAGDNGKKDFEHFESILKARRIAQFLYLKYSNQLTEKEALMQVHKRIKPKGFGDSEQSRKQLSFTLGLKLSTFPLGATIEELNWLHYDRRMDVLNAYFGFRKKIALTEKLTTEFIDGSDYVKDVIKANNFLISWSVSDDETREEKKNLKKHLVHKISFHKETFTPYIFDRTDIAVLIRWLSSLIQKERNEKQMKLFLDKFCEELTKIWKYGKDKKETGL